MDLPAAIDLNRTALARIVAGLFALLGLQTGASPSAFPGRISGAIRRTILRALRPAESAARRLIVLVARFTRAMAPPLRPRPAGLVCCDRANARPAFQLFDSRQRFLPQTVSPASPRPQPRIFLFGNGDVRRMSLVREPAPPKQDKADKTNPENLLRRLEALQTALNDLPRQARRLTRALARRQNVPRLKFKGPLRPGHAPGFVRQARLDVDHILSECDWLARETLPPDTS